MNFKKRVIEGLVLLLFAGGVYWVCQTQFMDAEPRSRGTVEP